MWYADFFVARWASVVLQPVFAGRHFGHARGRKSAYGAAQDTRYQRPGSRQKRQDRHERGVDVVPGQVARVRRNQDKAGGCEDTWKNSSERLR